MSFAGELIIIVLMLVMNAFCAAYEMALASVSRARLSVLVNRKRKGAEEAAFMKDRMEASLAVVQVGITLCGAIAAATGGAGVIELIAPYLQNTYGFSDLWARVFSLIFLIIPLSGVTIIFAELIPKMFALNNRESICLWLSPMMKMFFQIAYPVIIVMESIVKWVLLQGHKSKRFRSKVEDRLDLHELTAAVTLARASRLIGAREEKIVLSAAQLSVRPVKDIMLSASDISMIWLECALSEALLRAHMDMHTRFPVCSKEGDPQTIIGYLNFKDIMMALKLNPADPSVKGIVRPIKTVESTAPISQVLERMMQEKLHIALVAQEGIIIGMVTLEDIIEELVGEIEDEFDRLPTHIHPYGAGWIMGGGVPMNLVAQAAGVSWAPEESGEPAIKLFEWVARKRPGVLIGGEVIEGNGLQVMVRKLRRKKLGEAIVSLRAASLTDPAEGGRT